MGFGGSPRTRSHLLSVDITPMVDIVFLLIIFFMTAAQFARMNRVRLELPIEQGEQTETSDEAGLIINVDASGRVLVGGEGEPLSLEQLRVAIDREIVHQAGGDVRQVKLMIRADRHGDTARLNEIVRLLQDMGIGVTRLATEVPR